MQTLLTLSAKQSKNLDDFFYRNAQDLKSNAELIVNSRESYGCATSLLVLSLEETVKAILVKLHSEGLRIYKLEDSRKFFKDHRIRHKIAQMIELGDGLFESSMEYSNNKTSKKFKNNLLGSFLNAAVSSKPFLQSLMRFDKLEKFDEYKQSGFYVDYRNGLLQPNEEISKIEYNSVYEALERATRFYKYLRIAYHSSVKNRSNSNELNKKKEDLKIFINDALEDFSLNYSKNGKKSN